MAELGNVETLKALEFRRSELKPHDQGFVTVHLAIGRHLPAIIAALEDRERLRAGSQQALKAIAACVVGWDYPDVSPMPEWAKRLESVVPLLQAALGIPVTLDHETSWHSTSSHNSKTQP